MVTSRRHVSLSREFFAHVDEPEDEADYQRDHDQQDAPRWPQPGGRLQELTSSNTPMTTEALRPPLMILTTKKSPMTSVMTKIDAQRDAGLGQRDHDLGHDAETRPAPPSTAASISDRSIRAIELKIGTIMKRVNRWT